jgi:lipopolysaccharide/colanic/teichoic acid biosynthesis glycosyltransferase
MRRALDVVCAAVGLTFLTPLFAIIALAIKLEDGGPVFYSHRRVGKDFRPFGILKFRSMIAGADQIGSAVTAAGDARVTRVGRVLRRYKLDELPQLVNIVRGEMRFVGPRAEVERYVQLFRSEYSVLLGDRPGITDPAALAFRNEEAELAGDDVEFVYMSQVLPQKLRLSIEYAKCRTLLTDLQVVLQTLRIIFRPSTEQKKASRAQAA